MCLLGYCKIYLYTKKNMHMRANEKVTFLTPKNTHLFIYTRNISNVLYIKTIHSEQKRKEHTNTLQLMFTGANVAWNIKEKTLKPLMARAHNFLIERVGGRERNNWFSFCEPTKVPAKAAADRVGCADSLSKIPSAYIFKLDLNDLALSPNRCRSRRESIFGFAAALLMRCATKQLPCDYIMHTHTHYCFHSADRSIRQNWIPWFNQIWRGANYLAQRKW
jgi:hypothetical protein